MHPQAKFIPLAAMSADCEFSHRGVVLRVRDGEPKHIGGVKLVDDGAREVEAEVSGLVVPDYENKGYWLVPEKYKAEVEAALEAKANAASAVALEAGKGE